MLLLDNLEIRKRDMCVGKLILLKPHLAGRQSPFTDTDMGARKPHTFLGGSQEARAAPRWGEARIEPWDHIQPRMVVEAGQIMVLAGERRRLQRLRTERTFRQFKKELLMGVTTAIQVVSNLGDTSLLKEITQDAAH